MFKRKLLNDILSYTMMIMMLVSCNALVPDQEEEVVVNDRDIFKEIDFKIDPGLFAGNFSLNSDPTIITVTVTNNTSFPYRGMDMIWSKEGNGGFDFVPQEGQNKGSYPGAGGSCRTLLMGKRSCTIKVMFNPTKSANFAQPFTFTYRDVMGSKSISKIFTGLAGTPASLFFTAGTGVYDLEVKERTVVDPTVVQIEISNGGELPATNLFLSSQFDHASFPGYDAVWQALDDANDPGEFLSYYGSIPGGWSITQNECSEISELKQGETCTVTVQFFPNNIRYFPQDPLDDPPIEFTGQFAYNYIKNPEGGTGQIAANFRVLSIGIEANFQNPDNVEQVQVDFTDTIVGRESNNSAFKFLNKGFNDGIPMAMIFSKGHEDPWDATAHVVAICKGNGSINVPLTCYKCIEGASKTDCIGADERTPAAFPNAFTEPLNNRRIFPFVLTDVVGCMGGTVSRSLPDGTPGGSCDISARFTPSFDAFDYGDTPDPSIDYEFYYTLKYDSRWKDVETLRTKKMGFFSATALSKARLIVARPNFVTGGFYFGNEATPGQDDLANSDVNGYYFKVQGDAPGALYKNNSGTCWSWDGTDWVTPAAFTDQYNCVASSLCGGGNPCTEDQFGNFDPNMDQEDNNYLYQYKLGAVAMVSSSTYRERIRFYLVNTGGSTATNIQVADALGNSIIGTATAQLGSSYYYNVNHNCTAIAPNGSCYVQLFLAATPDADVTAEYNRFLDTSVNPGPPPSGWKTLNISYDHAGFKRDDGTDDTSQSMTVQWTGTLVQKGYIVMNIDDTDPASPPVDGIFDYLVSGETDYHDITLLNVGTGDVSYIYLNTSFGQDTVVAQRNEVVGTTVGDVYQNNAGDCFLWDGATWNADPGCPNGPPTPNACNGTFNCTEAVIGNNSPAGTNRIYLQLDGQWSAFSVIPSNPGFGKDCMDLIYWGSNDNPPNSVDTNKKLNKNEMCTLRVKAQQLYGDRSNWTRVSNSSQTPINTTLEWDFNENALVGDGLWEYGINAPQASPLRVKLGYFDGAAPVVIPDGGNVGAIYKNSLGSCWEYRLNPTTGQKNWVPPRVEGDGFGVVYISAAGNRYNWNHNLRTWNLAGGGGDQTTASLRCNGGYRCAEDVFGISDPAGANGPECSTLTATNNCNTGKPCDEGEMGVVVPGVENSLFGSKFSVTGNWTLSANFTEEAKLALNVPNHSVSQCWSSHLVRRDYTLPSIFHPELYHRDPGNGNLSQTGLTVPSFHGFQAGDTCRASANDVGRDYLDGVVHYVVYGGAVMMEPGANSDSYRTSISMRNYGVRLAEITAFEWISGDTEIDFDGGAIALGTTIDTNPETVSIRLANPTGQTAPKRVYERVLRIKYKNRRVINSVEEEVEKRIKIVFEGYRKGDYPYITAKYQPYEITYDVVNGYQASSDPIAFIKPLQNSNLFESSDGNCYSFNVGTKLWEVNNAGACVPAGGTAAGCPGDIDCNSTATGVVNPNYETIGMGKNGAPSALEVVNMEGVNDPSGNGNHGIARVRIWLENPSNLDITTMGISLMGDMASSNISVNGTPVDEHHFQFNQTDAECWQSGVNLPRLAKGSHGKCWVDFYFRAILPATKTVYLNITYLIEDSGGKQRYFATPIRIRTEGKPPAEFRISGYPTPNLLPNMDLTNLEYLNAEMTTNVSRHIINLNTGWESNKFSSPQIKNLKIVGTFDGARYFGSADPLSAPNWSTNGNCYDWNSATKTWVQAFPCVHTSFSGRNQFSGKSGGGCATMLTTADYDKGEFSGGEGCTNGVGGHNGDQNHLMRVMDPNVPFQVVYQTFTAGPFTVTHHQGGGEKASFLSMYYDEAILSNGEIMAERNKGKISVKILNDILTNTPPADRSQIVFPIFDDGKRRAYANGYCLWGDTDTISTSLSAEVGFVTPSAGSCQIRFEFDVDPQMARLGFNVRNAGDTFQESDNKDAKYNLREQASGMGIEYWAYKRQTKRRAYFTARGHFSSDNVIAQGSPGFTNRAADPTTLRITFDMPRYESKGGQSIMGNIVDYAIYQREKTSLINRTKDKWNPEPIKVDKVDYDNGAASFFLPAIPGRYVYWRVGVDREMTSNGLIHRYRAETDSPVGLMLMPPTGTVMRWDDTEGIYWLVDLGITTPEPFGVDRDSAIDDCEESSFPLYVEGTSSNLSKKLMTKEAWAWVYADSSRSGYNPDMALYTHWFDEDSEQLDDALQDLYGCLPGELGCSNIYDVNAGIAYDTINKVVYRKPCVSEIGLDECDEVYQLFGFSALLEAIGYTIFDHNLAEGGIDGHARCIGEINVY